MKPPDDSQRGLIRDLTDPRWIKLKGVLLSVPGFARGWPAPDRASERR